jgi:hypothetical protein
VQILTLRQIAESRKSIGKRLLPPAGRLNIDRRL